MWIYINSIVILCFVDKIPGGAVPHESQKPPIQKNAQENATPSKIDMSFPSEANSKIQSLWKGLALRKSILELHD